MAFIDWRIRTHTILRHVYDVRRRKYAVMAKNPLARRVQDGTATAFTLRRKEDVDLDGGMFPSKQVRQVRTNAMQQTTNEGT